MTGDDAIALVLAICLVPLGGLIACVDSALGRVSVARVDEFLREDRPGARALSVIVADRARYTNLLLMLRMTCELTATVLVFIVSLAVGVFISIFDFIFTQGLTLLSGLG